VKKVYRFFSWFFWLVLLLALLLAGLVGFVLSSVKAQTYLTKQGIAFLANYLNTEISYSDVSVDIFNNITCDNLLIRDWDCDTLLYTGKAKIDISELALLQQRVVIENIELHEPYFRLVRKPYETYTNLDYLLKQYPKANNSKPANNLADTLAKINDTGFTWDLNLHTLTLTEGRFSFADGDNNTLTASNLKKLSLAVERLDLAKKTMQIEQILIDGVNFTLFEGKRLHPKKPKDYSQIVHITPAGWQINIGSFLVKQSQALVITDSSATVKQGLINSKKLKLTDINLDAGPVSIANDTIKTQLLIGVTEQNADLTIQELKAKALITATGLQLDDLLLSTANSNISGKLGLQYSTLYNFNDFVNLVGINLDLAKNSQLSLKDIAHFSSGLNGNSNLNKFMAYPVKIGGQITGRIPKLKAQNLEVQFKNTVLRGNVKLRGLPDIKNTNIDADIASLNTDINEVKYFLPNNAKLPSQLNTLGKVQMAGLFVGYINEFIAEATVKTAVGTIKSDLKMALKGTANTTYSGRISAQNLDLGALTNKPELLGKTSFDVNAAGKGLSLATLATHLNGKIEYLTLKNYQYNNIEINGDIKQQFFAGIVDVNDANLNLDFDGKIDFSQATPQYRFNAKVDKANLHQLNLLAANAMGGNLTLNGIAEIELSGTNLDDIVGKANLTDLVINKSGKPVTFKTFKFVADKNTSTNERNLRIESDIADANISGNFTFKDIVPAIQDYLSAYFPRYVKPKGAPLQHINFDISFKNTQNLADLFNIKLEKLAYGIAKGNINTGTRRSEIFFEAKQVVYDGIVLDDASVEANSDTRFLNFKTKANAINIKNKQNFAQLKLEGKAHADSIDFDLALAPDTAHNRLRADGLFVTGDTLKLFLNRTDIVIKNEGWETTTGRFFYKDQQYFLVDDIVLRNGAKQILLRSEPSPTLKNITELQLENIDIKEFEYIKTISNLGLGGIVNGVVNVSDLFNQQIAYGELEISDLVFFKQYMARGRIKIEKTGNDPLLSFMAITDGGDYKLRVDGSYKLRQKNNPDNLDLVAVIDQAPTSFASAFIGTIASDIEGTFGGKMRIVGPTSALRFDGRVMLRNTSATIDMLQTNYRLHNQFLEFRDNGLFLDLNITDRDKKTASVKGNIDLSDFKNIRMDVNIATAEPFLFMDTKYTDNPLYYGTAYGIGNVHIYGPVTGLALDIAATTTKGTVINLPISTETSTGQSTIYSFINKADTLKLDSIKLAEKALTTIPISTGVRVDMDLNITSDAAINIIFDEATGDIIKGHGRGNLQIDVNTIGDFYMGIYGKYELTDGEYLFTLQEFVKKKFSISGGSTITFNGDPYQATLDVDAIHQVKTSRIDLFTQTERETLTANEANELKKVIPIDVVLKMTGSLFKPDLSFNIIPRETNPSLATNLAQGKLEELIAAGDNELSKQIFGLLVINKFMPPDQFNLDIGSSATATVTEWISSYMSNFLNESLGRYLGGTQINVGFDANSQNTETGEKVATNTVDIELQKKLLNDRLTLQIGGSVDVSGEKQATQGNNATNFATDLLVLYDLTPDGAYKIKAFNKYDSDVLNGLYNKAGVAITFTHEFDKLKEIIPKKPNKK
jgi:hypothetical protein